jgi:GntR family phosphonate transport system transcriptional regulator
MTSSGIFAPPRRGTGVAVWKQIADTLAGEIRDRVFAETGRLPAETALAERFGVNRHTLRQALAELQIQGLLRVEQGRGAFVQQDFVDYALSRRTRFTENLQRQGLLPSKQLLAARETTAGGKVACALKIERGARVLCAEMLDEADSRPIGLMTAYYPADRFAGLLELLLQGTRTTELLKTFGVEDYLRAESRITTQLPTDEVAHLLAVPKARPVLCIESIDIDAAGVPIKYGETIFSGDRVQLVVSTDEN